MVLGGVVNLPLGFDLSGVVTARSARRFNITTGRDNNGDGVLADRPNTGGDPGVHDHQRVPVEDAHEEVYVQIDVGMKRDV